MEQSNCFYHKERAATAICVNCGAPICAECSCHINDNRLCPSCYQTACKQNVKSLSADLTYFIGYIAIALVFYIVGAVVLFSGDGIGMILLGVLLMGIPNVCGFFRRSAGIFATVRLWLLLIVLTIVLGIVATPIIIIINIVKACRVASGKKYWAKLLKECNEVYPFLN